MTRDKLKEAIKLLLTYYEGEGDIIVEGIVMLVEEAGYKSPEQCQEEFQIEFEAWARENAHICLYDALGSEIEKCRICGKVRTMVRG
jgi:hypothetical protein